MEGVYLITTDYEPFDQDRWLGDPPWEGSALDTWEIAHGHDARLKCYVEFGCMVIEPTLERQVAALRNYLLEMADLIENGRVRRSEVAALMRRTARGA